MKKTALIMFGALTLVLLVTAGVGAANVSDVVDETPEKTIGLDYPSYGWAMKNDQGQITGYQGFNLGMGYSRKNYFEAGLKTEQFNPYWGWGTVGILVPYVNVGGDYVLEPKENGAFWTVGASIGIPTAAHFTASYRF